MSNGQPALALPQRRGRWSTPDKRLVGMLPGAKHNRSVAGFRRSSRSCRLPQATSVCVARELSTGMWGRPERGEGAVPQPVLPGVDPLEVRVGSVRTLVLEKAGTRCVRRSRLRGRGLRSGGGWCRCHWLVQAGESWRGGWVSRRPAVTAGASSVGPGLSSRSYWSVPVELSSPDWVKVRSGSINACGTRCQQPLMINPHHTGLCTNAGPAMLPNNRRHSFRCTGCTNLQRNA